LSACRHSGGLWRTRRCDFIFEQLVLKFFEFVLKLFEFVVEQLFLKFLEFIKLIFK